jgi:hypothetical protein
MAKQRHGLADHVPRRPQLGSATRRLGRQRQRLTVERIVAVGARIGIRGVAEDASREDGAALRTDGRRGSP